MADDETTPTRRTSLVRAAGLIATANVFAVLAGLVTGPIIARALEPSGRGALAAIVAPIGLLGLVGQFSASEFASQQIAKRRTTGVVLGTITPVMLAAAVTLSALCWPLAGVIADGDPNVKKYLELGLLVMPVGILVPLITGVAIGRERWTRAALATAIPPWAYVIAVLSLVAVGELRLGTAAVATIAVTVAGGLAYVGVRPPAARSLRFDRPLARAYASYAARTTPGLLATMANLRLDQILMFGIVGSAELGLYAVAVTIAGISTVVVSPMASVTVPAIASGEHALIPRATRLSLAAATVSAAGVAIASYPMLLMLFGTEFTDAELMLLILLAAQIPTVGTSSIGFGLRTVGRPGLASLADLLAIVVTVPMLLVLLPALGGEGAAITSLAAYSLTFAVLCVVTAREIGAPISEFLVIRRSDIAMVRERTAVAARARFARSGSSSNDDGTAS